MSIYIPEHGKSQISKNVYALKAYKLENILYEACNLKFSQYFIKNKTLIKGEIEFVKLKLIRQI